MGLERPKRPILNTAAPYPSVAPATTPERGSTPPGLQISGIIWNVLGQSWLWRECVSSDISLKIKCVWRYVAEENIISEETSGTLLLLRYSFWTKRPLHSLSIILSWHLRRLFSLMDSLELQLKKCYIIKQGIYRLIYWPVWTSNSLWRCMRILTAPWVCIISAWEYPWRKMPFRYRTMPHWRTNINRNSAASKYK